MRKKSYRANNPVSVLDKIVGADESQPLSADNPPVAMVDRSMAAGTPREPQEGKCIVGNGSAYVDLNPVENNLKVQNFEFELKGLDLSNGLREDWFYNNYNPNGFFIRKETNSQTYIRFYIDGTGFVDVFLADAYETTGLSHILVKKVGSEVSITNKITGVIYIHPTPITGNILYTTGNTSLLQFNWSSKVFDFIFRETDVNGDIINNIFHYKCDEGSGDIAYDSSGNGNHGTIQNYYAGFWGNQNEISYQNDVGYSELDSFDGSSQYKKLSSFDITRGLKIKGTIYTSTPSSNMSAFSVDGSYYRLAGVSGVFWLGASSVGVSVLEENTIDLTLIYISDTSFSYSGTINGIAISGTKSSSATNKILYQGTRDDSGLGAWWYGEQTLRFSYSDNNENITFEFSNTDTILVPRDESITLPPFKDVLGNDLQYIGLVPSKAKFVGSNCFEGDGSGHLKSKSIFSFPVNYEMITNVTIANGNTTHTYVDIRSTASNGVRISSGVSGVDLGFTINTSSAELVSIAEGDYLVSLKVYNSKAYYSINGGAYIELTTQDPSVTPDDSYITIGTRSFSTPSNFMITGQQVYNTEINELDASGNFVQTLAHWPLSEPITDAANHTAFDVSGNGNHATLINGSLANQGVQDEFHWGQLGFSDYGDNKANNSYFLGTGLWSNYGQNTNETDNVEFYSNGASLKITRVAQGDGNDPYFGYRYLHAFIDSLKAPIPLDVKYRVSFWAKSNLVRSDFGLEVIGTDFVGRGKAIDQTWRRFTFDFTHTVGDGSTNFSAYIRFRDGDLGNYPDMTVWIDELRFQITQFVPASAALDGTDALGNPLTVVQDGNSFLDTGTKLEHQAIPRVIQADSSGKWFNTNGEPQSISYDSLEYYPDNKKYFADNITRNDNNYNQIILHSNDLCRRQKDTEIRIRESEVVPIMSFQTNYSGTWGGNLATSSGTLKWVVDGVEQITNSPSYELIGNTVDVKVFRNDVPIDAEIVSCSFFDKGIIGTFDVSWAKINAELFYLHLNPLLEYVLFDNSQSNVVTGAVQLYSSGIKSININNFSIGGVFRIYSNASLQVCTVGNAAFAAFEIYNCDVLSLDFNDTTLSNAKLDIRNNVNIASLLFSSNLNTISGIFCQNFSALTSIDLSNVQIIGGQTTSFDACSSVTSLIFKSGVVNILSGGSVSFNNMTSLAFIDLSDVELDCQYLKFGGSSLYSSIAFPANNHDVSIYIQHQLSSNLTDVDLSNVLLSGNLLRGYGCSSLVNYSLPQITTNIASIELYNNALNQASINNILSDLNVYFSSNAPVKDLTLKLDGGTNASPTGGASNTDLQSLVTIFNNAGFTLTYLIN